MHRIKLCVSVQLARTEKKRYLISLISHVLLNVGSISPSKIVFILNSFTKLLSSDVLLSNFFGRKGCIDQLFT